ncbi:MAG: quaternary ammonium compound-resistance protein SugE [Candidatus Methanomethylophilaceae archaeon]|nr:quaternary ammonium compound-resistance protein SugE [Candidatus Methanomethylophilaceae archaeon]
MIWVLAGGLLEPVWVIGLNRLNERRTLPNILFAGTFMILSPLFLSFGMKDMGMGIAYSIRTGVGAVATLAVGYLMYHDDMDLRKIGFASLIVAGVIGIELFSGASA